MSRDIVSLSLALAALTIAGDRFIVYATTASLAFRIRPVIVGTLVGGLGTSIPELMVAPIATVHGRTTLAIGVIVGSVIANIAFGLAPAAFVRPPRIASTTIRREVPISVAAVGLFGLATVGGVSHRDGVMLLVAMGVVLWLIWRGAREAAPDDELAREVITSVERTRRDRITKPVAMMIALGSMLLGAEVVVRSASDVASRLGWSAGLIGMTVVAIGTSTPLIASSIHAARRDEGDVLVGDVLGSDVFIALLGGALVGLLHHGGTVTVDASPVVAMVLLAAVTWPLLARGNRLTRPEASIILAAYVLILPIFPR